MRTLFLYAFLLILAASLISCQKIDDGVSFKSIYSNNDINKIIIRDKYLKFKEITDNESMNNWIEKVREIKFIRDENQKERDFLLIYDGYLVKAFHQDQEIYKDNAEFDKQVELLCK